MPIAPRKTNLAEVAREVVDEIRLSHPDRTIEVAVAGSCEGTWDPDRLAQVVSNLIENALAHSAAGISGEHRDRCQLGPHRRHRRE